MSQLLNYVNEVDKNAVMRAAHQAEPFASMSAFGLTADEQRVVFAGDKDGLAKAIGIEMMDIPSLHVPDTVFLPTEQVFRNHSTVLN